LAIGILCPSVLGQTLVGKMIKLLHLIEVGLIWIADYINLLYSPFKKSVYSQRMSNDAIGELEGQLYGHMNASFVERGRFKYQLPMPADEGDAALFQGLYTAMMNFKHNEVTPELQAANAALGGFFIDGILIRGVRSDGTVNDTTSNDSATGALLGLYSIWRKGTWEADYTIQRWASRIVTSGYALTDLNGVPTKYGQLVDGWRTDPLRLTLLLAILALAMHTKDVPANAKMHYDILYRRYRLLLKYPKVKLLWWDTDYDTHRAAIHLHVLYNLTGDQTYADGLGRIARITEAENNAWVQILCWPFNGISPNLGIMHTFTLAHRTKGNIESLNSPYFPGVKWGSNTRSVTALPIRHRGSQEFFWQRNMFSLDEWVGNKQATVHHSGLDYLLAYWLAVRLKLPI